MFNFFRVEIWAMSKQMETAKDADDSAQCTSKTNPLNESKRKGALKCELELIPVVAGECRAEPTSITNLGNNLIRSYSVEVSHNNIPKQMLNNFNYRMPWIEKGNRMS